MTTTFKQALEQSNLDETARSLAYPSRVLPNPLGFCESFQQYAGRCGIGDHDCTCRSTRRHYAHDNECPVGVVYQKWDAFMRERWDDVRAWHEANPKKEPSS